MQVTRTDRAVAAFSVLASAYVAFLVLDFYVFKLDWILLDVVRELLTIPLILAVAAAFVFVVAHLLANRKSVNVCNGMFRADPVRPQLLHLGQLRVLTGAVNGWVEWVDEPVPGYPKRPVPRRFPTHVPHADGEVFDDASCVRSAAQAALGVNA